MDSKISSATTHIQGAPDTWPTYSLHGLKVRSEIPLARDAVECADPDVTVSWAEEPSALDGGGREVLAQYATSSGGYTVARGESDYLIRFDDLCDVEIALDFRTVRVRVERDEREGIVPLLVGTHVLATVLLLRGECVLHASGIENAGCALGIVGGSGAGKSTLAALFCAAGARLVSDDLLRIAVHDDRSICFLGNGVLRLRPPAEELAAAFPASSTCTIADGRLGLAPEQTDAAVVLLGALLIPVPSRTTRSLEVQRLRPAEAALELSAFPRVIGWESMDVVRSQFVGITDIVRRVPVFRAQVPWGPPFDGDLAASLLRAVGLPPPPHVSPLEGYPAPGQE